MILHSRTGVVTVNGMIEVTDGKQLEPGSGVGIGVVDEFERGGKFAPKISRDLI